MSILLLGAGRVGYAVAEDLSEDFDLHISDSSEENLSRVKDHGKVSKVDADDIDELEDVMGDHDIAVSALPGALGINAIKASLKSGTDLVDISFMPQDPLEYDERAKEKGVTIVPDAGFSPGLGNVLMGHLYHKMNDMREGRISVGGLPVEPEPPLYYTITWSPYDLIEEYTRQARLVRDGQITEVDPLEKIEEVSIQGYDFEEFYSDGLRTLLHTIDVEELTETTLRWPGHLEKIKVLRELGFFDEEHLDDTLNVITPLMDYDSRDMCLMKVWGEGEKREEEYIMYDEGNELSSMSRTTGFTAAIISRILVEEDVDQGVIPPELLGMDDHIFQKITSGVKKRGITLRGRRMN